MQIKYFISSLIVVVLFAIGCRKQESFLSEGGRIVYSVDTLFFDTVFTSAKSSTHILKIYNKEDQFVKVNVALKNGENSSYTINIDGTAGKSVNDVEIAGLDSAIVFVTMLVDPTDESLPFLIEDELITTVNENQFSLPIVGYGQNAYYLNDTVLSSMTFNVDKPYVIINSALIAEGEKVVIPAGARIYFHRNSRLFVQGSLEMNGTKDEKILVQGDRIDRRIYVGTYDDVPGEWGGIYFLKESHNNIINYAIIKNGGLSTQIGTSSTLPAMIQLDQDTRMDGTPKLRLTNSIIKNSVAYGVIAFQSSLYAENTFILDCQDINLALLQGGDYVMNDCTISTYGQIRFFSRKLNTISVLAQNYYQLTETNFIDAPLKAVFNNTIISGSSEEEFIVNNRSVSASQVELNHCLIKHKESIPSMVMQNNNLYNLNPEFIDLAIGDFNLLPTSPVIGKGKLVGILLEDFNGELRPNPPSIGAVEPLP